MRDYLLLALILSTLPVVVTRAWIGILVYAWIGYMNPHRLTWGVAYDFPFAKVIGITTLVAALFSGDKRRFPFNGLTLLWIFWVLWMNVTTLFAMIPDRAWFEWDRAMKIQLICLLSVVLINTRRKLEYLVWVIVLSLAFYGVKGGIFTVLTGGNYKVWGPPESFITDNNALALALIMTMPLMYYLSRQVSGKVMRWALIGSICLCALSVLGTYSRGGMLAGAAMSLFLIIKSRNSIWLGLAVLIVLPLALGFMPEQWFARMESIGEYQADGSAMGRINAWTFAFNLALERPILGGGYNVFSRELFQRFAPDPDDFHDAHSIYFEVLAEHGFVGLGLFLMLLLAAFRAAGRTAKQARDIPGAEWIATLAAMLQVSLVAYAVAGAFQGLAYFDLYYQIVGMIVVVTAMCADARTATVAGSAVPSGRPLPLAPHPGVRRSTPS